MASRWSSMLLCAFCFIVVSEGLGVNDSVLISSNVTANETGFNEARLNPPNGDLELCDALPDSGPCHAYIPSWFHNCTTGQCQRFVYGGCGGNSNRYATEAECQKSCGGRIRCLIEVKAYNSYKGPCSRSNDGYVQLNGSTVWTAGWCSPKQNRRGVNIIVVDPSECKERFAINFDTRENPEAATDMVAFLQVLGPGTVVVGVSGDDPTPHMSAALQPLELLGITLDDLALLTRFAFVFQKGYPKNVAVTKFQTSEDMPHVREVLHLTVTGVSVEDLQFIQPKH